MIVLPNTPPMPVQLNDPSSALPQNVLTLRSSLQVPSLSNYNESIRYVINLEQYLDAVIELAESVDASNAFISTNIPWSSVSKGEIKMKLFKVKSNKPVVNKWTLSNELSMTLISIALIYNRVASDLANETINLDLEPPAKPEDYNENWKQVMSLYKKSISMMLFAEQIGGDKPQLNEGVLHVNATIFSSIMKVTDLSIQMSILSKFLWISRYTFDQEEIVSAGNSMTLAKVAIYCMNELDVIQRLLDDLNLSVEKSVKTGPGVINLDYSEWDTYLQIITKYVSAYAGFYLAVQSYRDNKFGNALGLIQFSLLSLQSKKDLPTSSFISRKVTLKQFRDKLSQRKQENILSNLNSVSTLDINKSAFSGKSGIILNDLSYLFDQLIKLNLKISSENNTLYFQELVHWSAVNSDSKWPIGCKIPVSQVGAYSPRQTQEKQDSNYTGRGEYY
ncbi:hypothetical protein CANMA_003618 [Candida margitis]|uniref:uncharacterized protein n=1 Tax=Candida margitis TaxID=1775924 RepID=UPI002227528F|nr:uncharacterized protein CANMA_003618 [Candida margitis]KAI5962843.1 hypothetical protein CANMA_003618 [Candida margitis]